VSGSEATAGLRPGSWSALDALAWTAVAGLIAAVLVWFGPPGSDVAAHVYQRALFVRNGFTLWDNLWYGGRYSFITYSVVYYPLAAVLGIKLLAVVTVVVAAVVFAAVVAHEWGRDGRWSSRAFAIFWAALVLSGAFPFMLGSAWALLALYALQRRGRWRFVCFATLTLASSPVAFLLLVIVLAGIALGRRHERATLVTTAATVCVIGLIEVLLWRMFPDRGRYPFSPEELAAACVFCLYGAALTWNVAQARIIRWIFVAYLAACIACFVIPSPVGENIARLRFAAVPISILALSLRAWRPRLACVVALGLALSWNVTPLAASFRNGADDPAARAAYWAPAIAFLESHVTASYRVEAVDTVGHWPAAYLARAGIPLARGWFRQEDFPRNRVLYSDLSARAYLAWLHKLAVRYVVLPSAQPDYSARAESRLVASGRAGLEPVFRSPNVTIFAVPSPQPLILGPGRASVLALDETHVRLRLPGRGTYRLAISYSPYWRASSGCLEPSRDGMIRLRVARAAVVRLVFVVNASRAFSAVTGDEPPQGCRRG
jgi:hypothetical protein